MTVYLLSSESSRKNNQIAAIEAKLITIVPGLRKIEKIEDFAGEIGDKPDTRFVVIFVSPTLAGSDIENFINAASRYHHRVFFILVSNEISGADYKRLIRSGDAEWVAATGLLQEIPELIINRQRLPSEASQSETRPTIVSFVPCAGGVGNTTIALEVALQIKLAKASRSWKMCYIDFDFQTSHVCDYLDIEARFQIQEILDRPERLDEQLFELFVSHHQSGLDVFAAPRSKVDPCAISASVLDPLLDMIVKRYDYIILDLPISWFSWTGPTLESSDAIILTGINTIPCLRQMKATLDAVVNTKVSSSQVAIVMNRVSHRLLGGVERRGHVESVFPNENIFYIYQDADAVDRVNTGVPAALGSNQAKDFVKLSSYCTTLRQTASRELAR